MFDVIETDDLDLIPAGPQSQSLQGIISHIYRPYSSYTRCHIYLLLKANYRNYIFRLLLYHIMKTFAIHTLGCKVNQYESQQIGQLLAEFGLIFAPAGTCADLVVINTCCVTSIASSKSRQSIRKAQKLHPSAAIVIAGCLPAGDADEMSNIDGNVHVVAEKDDLAKSIEALITSSNAGLAACDTKSDTTLTVSENINKNPQIGPNHSRTNSPPEIKHKAALRPLKFYSGQSRAFLKVQDGCDGYC
ncbi:hypothetical protein LCGC14_2730410, partial [marine sediment metagenome]